MTEDEAKTKWCPFARTIFGKRAADNFISVAMPQQAFNRYTMDEAEDLAIPGGAACIGSACMAWRWHKREGATLYSRKEGTDEKLGFCGLAGKP